MHAHRRAIEQKIYEKVEFFGAIIEFIYGSSKNITFIIKIKKNYKTKFYRQVCRKGYDGEEVKIEEN